MDNQKLQMVSDSFAFLEGLVSEATYLQVVEKARDLIERDGWISVSQRLPPACHYIIAYGRSGYTAPRCRQVYSTYTGTRPRDTVEDEQITYWKLYPNRPPMGDADE
ncbi:hypothetical protein FDI24_gp150 [Acidovorax phage ACP17]|uniref:Uncharacterized protein n=1 Tax=Acidovorax phage ACP17 TaxID=2010329 RepID=A0A218M308_9CAUD|nr:hypothetical protein FDI24_gp150 [Acidovorax phage ACP17]ASD50431.1 hypothetical protein [Acidovorax phage ACP17]